MKTLYLVTGAAGYLGGEVCRQLVARGLQGRALVLPGDKTAQYIPKQIEQCVGDLCDTASLEKFFQVEPDTETIVLHCASMVALGNERRELVMKVNVQGTQNIIDQCFAHKECKKLIYVGSTGSIPELPQVRFPNFLKFGFRTPASSISESLEVRFPNFLKFDYRTS